jgi:glutamyl-Q tRNA(Asp) synthetase
MEDLDSPRVVPGCGDDILRTLDALGLEWDGIVVHQDARRSAYAEALEALRREGLLFPCACSRKDVAIAGREGAEGPIYPGTCRLGLPSGRRARTLRVRTESRPIRFSDLVQGELAQNLQQEVGDFVLRRADGIHTYQLAVVVDDAFQGVTGVVRGADLVLSTPRQIFLQHALGFASPEYAHLPVAVDARGRKLSKSDAAAPVHAGDPLPALLQAWRFLGQPPFPEAPANLREFREQALRNWSIRRVPAARALPVPPRRCRLSGQCA